MQKLAHAVEAMVELGQISSKTKVVKEYLANHESQIEEDYDSDELDSDLENYLTDEDFNYDSLSKEDLKFITDFKEAVNKGAKSTNDDFEEFMDNVILHEEQKVFGSKKAGLPEDPESGSTRKTAVGEY